MRRRDLLKAGMGAAALLGCEAGARSRAARLSRGISLLERGTAGPLPLLGLRRVPDAVKSDFKLDASAAPLDTYGFTWIAWHARQSKMANHNFLDVGYFGDTNFIPGSFLYGTEYAGGPYGIATHAMRILQIDDSYPFTDVFINSQFGVPNESDGPVGPGPDYRVSGFYRIPSDCQASPYRAQLGDPCTIGPFNGNPPSPPNLPYEDRHLLLYNLERNTCDEFINVWYNAPLNQWSVAQASRFDMSTMPTSAGGGSTHDRPVRWASTSASGMCYTPALLTYDEAYDTDGLGEIDHGFMFNTGRLGAWSPTLAQYVYPASHAQGELLDTNALPIGCRLRLRDSYREDLAFTTDLGLPEADVAAMRRFCRALKTYGVILVDGTGVGYERIGIYANYDGRWNDEGTITREGVGGTGAGRRWLHAFRFATPFYGVTQWRPGALDPDGDQLPASPCWWDFDVVLVGWPVDSEMGIVHAY